MASSLRRFWGDRREHVFWQFNPPIPTALKGLPKSMHATLSHSHCLSLSLFLGNWGVELNQIKRDSETLTNVPDTINGWLDLRSKGTQKAMGIRPWPRACGASGGAGHSSTRALSILAIHPPPFWPHRKDRHGRNMLHPKLGGRIETK